ncbi:MAG: Wzz/FepE/Etk N-terminal domain-containing protein [Desulfohalobiaceae bacterium]
MSSAGRQDQEQTNHSYYHEDISLIDLWLMIVRRKLLVISVAAAMIVLGAAYAWMQPENYEFRTSVELAGVHYGPDSRGLKLLDSVSETGALLEDFLIPAKRQELSEEEALVPKVDILERGSKQNIILTSIASHKNQDGIKQLHEGIVQELAKHQAQGFEEAISTQTQPLQAKSDMLQEKIQLLEDQLQSLVSRSRDAEGIRSLIDAQQMGDLRRELAQARQDRTEAEAIVQTIREASHESRINFLAAASEEAVGMGTKLILTFSVVLGLMLGVIGAFVCEFCRRARQALKQDNA